MRFALALTLVFACSVAHALDLGKAQDAARNAAPGATKAASDAATKAVAGSKAPDAKAPAGPDDNIIAAMNKKLQNVQAENGPVLFKAGKAVVDPKCDKTMQAIADILTQFPGTHVVVNGHTDNVGKKDANLRLSEQRAKAVVDYLVKRKGCDLKRLEGKGYGDQKPIEDNKTAAGRAKNRRVDFTVTRQ